MPCFIISGCSRSDFTENINNKEQEEIFDQPLAQSLKEENLKELQSENEQKIVKEEPTKEKPPEVQKALSSVLDSAIFNLKGETVIDMELAMYDFYKNNKPSEEELVGYFGAVDFLNDCDKEVNKFLPEHSGLSGKNYVTETPMFFPGEEDVSLINNISVVFTSEKYRECLLRHVDQPKNIPEKFYFYNSLAKSLGGSFVLGSISLLNLEERPSLCSLLLNKDKKEFCLNFKEDDVIKYLKDYYKLSGVISALKNNIDAKNDIVGNYDFPTSTDEYISKKIKSSQQGALSFREMENSGNWPENNFSVSAKVESIEDVFSKVYSSN